MPSQPCYYCNMLVDDADDTCPHCQQSLLFHYRYRPMRMLGRGGFGVVYEAFDTRLNRRCAIKAVTAVSLAEQRQIEAEAAILSQHAARLTF